MKKIFTSILITAFFLTITSTVLAQPVQPAQLAPDGMDYSKDKINLGSKQLNGIKAVGNPNANVGNIISNFVLIMYIIGGLAVLVFFVWGAFDWITSGGDKEKISSARRKIMNTFIGLILLALAYFIISLVGQIAGFDPLKTPDLPKLDQAQP